jgi:glycosyltransferase involved in cell wall biosynthesis
MAEAPTILYFGNDWSGENRTSSHHVARWLAARYRVVYVECPGLRAPKGTGRDLRKILRKLRLALSGPRPQPEGLSVQTLLQIPLHRFELVRRANRALIRLSLWLLLMRMGVRSPVTWFVVPHLSGVVGRLGERLSVYYCIDDYASLPDVDADAVRAMDEELTRRADLVFVASETLVARKAALNPETHVSPHGVDFDHFVRAQDPALAVPEDAAGLPRPIVGFFGLIERWIDLGLVGWLAERRPSWTFLMIGRVAVPESDVPRRPNIAYLGRRPYETLPAYGKAFDAALIPYHLTPQVLHANPIKLREYLAMGKPIVSVSTPEIDKFAAHVRIGRSREEMLAHLDAAVSKGLDPGERDAQIALASTMTWDANLRKVLERVEERLAGGRGESRPPGLEPRRREG